MDMTRRVLMTSDVKLPMVDASVFCCEECGDLCRELMEVMTPREFRHFMAANRTVPVPSAHIVSQN